MSESDLIVNVRANDQTTTVLSKAGEEYFAIAKKISDAQKATEALEKAQAQHAKITALTSDRDNPKLAASFVRVAEAMAKQKAAQEALEKAQAGDGPSSLVSSLERLGSVNVGPMFGAIGAGMAAVGVAGAAAGGAILALANHASEAGGKVQDVSDQLGVSAEFITSAGFGAKQSGASMELLAKSLTKLNVNASANAEGLRKLGVEVNRTGGGLKSTEELLYTAADALKGIEQPAERAEAATKMFGEAGVQLLPFLSEGAAGIKAMQAEADRLGVTMSSDTAEAAAAFGDALDAIGDQLSSVATKAGAVFLPAMTGAIEAAKEPLATLSRVLDENSEGLQRLAREGVAALVSAFASLVRGAGFVNSMFTGFRETVIDLQTSWLEFKRRMTWDESALKDIDEQLAALNAEFSDLSNNSEETERVFTDTAQALDGLAESLRKVSTADQAAAEKTKASAAAERLRARGLKETAKALEAFEKARTQQNKMDAAYERLEEYFDRERELVLDESMKTLEDKQRLQEEQDAEIAKNQEETDKDIEARREREKQRQEDARKAERAARVAAEREAAAEAQRALENREAEMRTLAEGVGEAFVDLGVRLGEAALEGGGAFKEAIGNALSDVRDQILKFAASSVFKILVGALTGGATTALGAVGGGGATGIFGALGSVFGFSEGGLVPSIPGSSPMRDSVPALLTPGELVVPRRQVEALRAAPPAAPVVNIRNEFRSATPVSRADVDRIVRDNIEPAIRRLKRQGLTF